MGKGAFMAKADMESVFRLLPVHPRHFCLLGITVNDFYLIDKSLPMGASCSPVLFENFPTFLEWATKTASYSGKKKLTNKQTNTNHTHISLIILFPSGLEDKANPLSWQKLVETSHQVCKKSGVPLATAKAVASIPETKINAIIQKVEDALQHTKITLKQMQSLLAHFPSSVKQYHLGGHSYVGLLI